MKKVTTYLKFTLPIFVSIVLLGCVNSKKVKSSSSILYKSANLIITQISENSFIHTSFKQTDDFGNVPCNGLIVRDSNEVVIFDTPSNDTSSDELIVWVTKKLHCKINAIIPTHFHDDCLGGLKSFDRKSIPSFANYKTIELAKENNMICPKNGFYDTKDFIVGDKKVIAKFFGEGHTVDNIVGYFESENILFGGCLIKELNASKGYLGDANLNSWSNTVEKVQKEYPNVKIVIPGHGKHGDGKLLDYTINLFKIK